MMSHKMRKMDKIKEKISRELHNLGIYIKPGKFTSEIYKSNLVSFFNQQYLRESKDINKKAYLKESLVQGEKQSILTNIFNLYLI